MFFLVFSWLTCTQSSHFCCFEIMVLLPSNYMCSYFSPWTHGSSDNTPTLQGHNGYINCIHCQILETRFRVYGTCDWLWHNRKRERKWFLLFSALYYYLSSLTGINENTTTLCPAEVTEPVEKWEEANLQREKKERFARKFKFKFKVHTNSQEKKKKKKRKVCFLHGSVLALSLSSFIFSGFQWLWFGFLMLCLDLGDWYSTIEKWVISRLSE